MNDEPPLRIGKWHILLAFAAGCVLTAFISAVEHGKSPLNQLIQIFFTLLGILMSVWILFGRNWKLQPRAERLRLGLAYLVVGWGGLTGMIINRVPGGDALIVLSGMLLAVLFIAAATGNRQRRRDEGDIFP